jgi:hypothetical protein
MTRPRRFTVLARAALGFVCALLLFAQQVGLSHAVWHATQQLPQPIQAFQEAGSGNLPSLPHASKLCPLDAALGQVLGAGPIAGFTFDHSPAVAHTPSCTADHPASLHALAPRSRGPPPLL